MADQTNGSQAEIVVVNANKKLPAMAVRIGGALPEVLLWEQHSGLSDKARANIAQIVRRNRELNTEAVVDLLADATGYHEVELDDWVNRQITEFSVEQFHLAIETLHEAGIRSQRDAKLSTFQQSEQARGHVEAMLTLISIVEEHTGRQATCTQLIDLVNRFNHWDDARAADPDEIVGMIDNPAHEPDYGEAPSEDDEDF